ncbi:flagellar filament capping protein FliD [uncultured Oscillibacter sp.]|uniref:flagellar filament capping protein FliD n=1 Tax=uncultured Oscillibacter sp. TaxID=876091 RepID=UPI0025F50558|nr:flagellar filament capping protein FliD [uncultured Oscillibacter sp.]
MASVSGVSSSNTSSIYGSRNVLSGLATGLDTESMIENAVSGFQTKIASLQKRQTSLTWKQEAMRGVSTPMIQFAQKYTSYSSSTNLLSANFFNKAVTTAANGKYADKISATGKSSSSVRILDVTKLATRATYSVSAAAMGLGGSADGKAAAVGTEKLELDAAMSLSRVSGTLSLQYGANRTIDISFDEVEDLYTAEDGKSAAQAFVDSINKKLAGTKVSNSSGEYVAASTMVEAKLDDNGDVVFSDKAGAGNSVTIAGATGKLKDNLGIDASSASSKAGTIVLADDFAFVDESAHRGEYLAGKSLKITLDGKTKTVELPGYEASDTAESYAAKLNDALQKSFGSSIGAELTSDGKLSFTAQRGSTLSVTADSAVGKALGLGGATATSYLDTGRTLGSLLGVESTDSGETLGGMTGTALKAEGKITYNKTSNTWTDSKGNLVDKDDNRLGEDGKQLYGYTFEMNGEKLTFTRDTAMESVLTAINSNTAMGVTATFSKITNSIQFTSRETGAASGITINAKTEDGADNLAAKLFGTADARGEDAELSMEINGQTYQNVTRADNTFDVDGMSITLKGTFDGKVTNDDGTSDYSNAVSFTTTSDADKIVDAINSMVKDLNDILKNVHDSYSTLPNYKSDNSRYEPLSDSDKDDMSDSAIEKYEEKAKQGILFGDSDLSSLYSKLVSAISPGGTASATLSKMGITTSYSDGVTSVTVDEEALRSALSNDPDSVRDAFVSTTGVGGLMTNVSKVVSDYAATTGATKGILVEKAGSTYSALSLLNNTLQDQIDNYDEQISKWQDKLSDKIDYYTKMFTRLETLTNQMNSQSSMLSGLMGN